MQSIGGSGREAMEVLNFCFETFSNANKKRGKCIDFSPISFMVRQAVFEPAAYGFVVRRSIRAELLALAKTVEIQMVHKLKSYCCQCLCFLITDARCWILDTGCSALTDPSECYRVSSIKCTTENIGPCSLI